MRTTGRFGLAICLALAVQLPGALLAQEASIPSRLSLADAVRLAEEQDPSLASARARVAVAAASAVSARQRPNPVLGFTSEGYRPWTAGSRSLNDQETAIELTQELDMPGRRRLRREAAAAGVGASEASARDQRRQLRFAAATAYYQLVLARSEADTASASLAEVDKVIAVNRARYKQGEVSGGELRRLEVERMRFSDDLLAAQLAEKNARSGLLALLGAPRLDLPLEPTDGLATPRPAQGATGVAPGVQATGAAAALPSQSFDASALVAKALAERPDLAASRQEEQRALSELRLQRALRTPTLSVGAGYHHDFGQHGLVVSASVPLPLFDRNAGGVARAEAERRLAASQARQVERGVSLEVQQAVNGVEAARARLSTLESEYLDKAREARDTALAAYRAGASDLIDYLDAQRAFRDVQRAHQRALFDHRVSLLQLDAATGALPGDIQP